MTSGIDLARRCAGIVADKRGEGIVILDLREHFLVDAFVVATCAGPRQLKAVARELDRSLKGWGLVGRHVEGEGEGGWVLVDAGDVVVHLFTPEARAHYDLELLWGDVPRVDFEPAGTGSQ